MDAERGHTMARITTQLAKPSTAKPKRTIARKAASPRLQRRTAVAKRLEEWARRLRAGQPIRVAGKLAKVPEWVQVEAEFETDSGKSELEIELKWTAPKRPKRSKK
jgi:amphi-Trp domain-containing protein